MVVVAGAIMVSIFRALSLLFVTGCGFDPPAPELTNGLRTFDLDFFPGERQQLTRDPHADIEADAVFIADGEQYEIEVEIHGASARNRPKLSYKLEFDDVPFSGSVFGGRDRSFRRLILKAMYADQSFAREAIAFEVLHLMGHDTPRIDFANLRINGKYEGLYVVFERIDKDYPAAHGFTGGGLLYKGVRQQGSSADFHPSRELDVSFENKTMELADFEPLEEFVQLIHETPATEEAFMEYVDPVFSIDAYLDRMIWIAITQNSDAIRQNFFLYQEPTFKHWVLFPWDSDISLSNHWDITLPVRLPEERPLITGTNYLADKLLSIEGIKKRYIQRFRHVLDEILTEQVLLDITAAYSDRLSSAVDRDLELWERSSTSEEEFDEIRNFFIIRRVFLKEALDQFQDE